MRCNILSERPLNKAVSFSVYNKLHADEDTRLRIGNFIKNTDSFCRNRLRQCVTRFIRAAFMRFHVRLYERFRLRDFVIRDFVIRDSDRHPSRVTRRNARSGVSVSSDVAEEDDLGHCSPPRSPVETAATCAAKTSSLPSSVSLHEDVFQSEKGEPKAKQAVPSQNDDAEEQRVCTPSPAADVVAQHSAVQTANIGANTVDHVSICLSVVPVYLAAGSRSISTVALLDPGSQGTLISNEMASRLGLARKPTDVHLSTFHGRDPLLSLSSVDFAIRRRNGRQQFDIKGALVAPSINVSCRTVNWNRERDKWTHLKDLSVTDVNYGKVSVLIGADNFEVKQPLALRKPPRKGEPFGMLTPLGWTVVGRRSHPFEHRRPSTERMINELLVRVDSPQQSKFEIYERFCKTESFGTQPVHRCQDIELSKIAWPSSFEFVHGRYEVGLLWKSDNVTLPNNRSMAKSRFESLRKRLINDPVLYDLHREALSCLSRSGIIRLVMPYEANSPVGRVWYLPHHPVRHPSKPGKGFGLTSAPSTCMYALLHCIRDFFHPKWQHVVVSNSVDNYLDSFSDAKEAIAYCVALREATARGGFPLVKWASTRPEVLLSFPERERSITSLDLSPGTHHVECVLGLL
ncbi:hypothetical protein M513_12009 [Trichuris suis]|uniref:Peptidase aspartic putative domain-containing protein n=1 Tax=Trichuris suis TaxID=68888 RepID=A0A085LQ53_9BILA|nr:hypothetical protein M513_12009 [Trichuris suis]